MARILLSALSARRGGGQTYLRHIVNSFPAEAGHSLSIYAAAPIPGLVERPNVEWLRAPSWTIRPIPRFLFGALYFRFLWPRRHNFDAVYYAGGSFDIALPPRIRKIVAFRNMLPFDLEARRRYHLGWVRFRHWLLYYLQSRAFRRADLVIFISEYARDAIDRVVPRRRGKSIVVPHGAAATHDQLDEVLAARLPESFVLYLSILDPYKAQVELVEAWAQMRAIRRGIEKLVLAGPNDTRYAAQVRETIARLKLDNEVILLGNVPHGQVSDLARRAVLNVFLSSCENCPNILLELMCVGVPMLVSAREPMPELGGSGLDYVDPYDVGAIARELGRLLDNPQHRQAVAAAALERSRIYTWPGTGERTWEAILACATETTGNVENWVADAKVAP